MHQSYLARLEKDGEGVLVTFPDLPEAITGGANEEDALRHAADALEVVVLTYLADGHSLPEPTELPEALHDAAVFRPVSLSAATMAKIAFIEAFRASGMTRTALAAKLGKAENEVRRMLDPYHATKLPALDAGLHALGKRLVVSVQNLAA